MSLGRLPAAAGADDELPKGPLREDGTCGVSLPQSRVNSFNSAGEDCKAAAPKSKLLAGVHSPAACPSAVRRAN
eukprot:2223666-Pleurochrysis_carterae.AAC.4